GLLRRLIAMMYDSLLLLGLSFAYGGIFTVWIPNWLSPEPTPLGELSYGPLGRLFFQLGWPALIIGFFLYFWGRGRQTFGMRASRMKMQSVDGGRHRLGQCLRSFALAALSMAVLCLGYLRCLFHHNRQTLHVRFSQIGPLVFQKQPALSHLLPLATG